MVLESIYVAIYNADLKRVEYITSSLSEATRIVSGKTNVSTDEKIRYALKTKKKIPVEKTILNHSVALRIATSEQMKLLGKNKSIKINYD